MKKKSIVIDFTGYIVLAGLIKLVRVTPRKFGYALARMLLTLVYYGWKRRRQITEENLKIAFGDYTREKLSRLSFDVYMNLASFCSEFPLIPDLKPENLESRIRFRDWGRLEEAYKKGRGVILVWAHYDNFEWVNAAIALKGMPIYSVIREVDNRFVDRLLDGIRESSGQKIIKRELAATEIIKKLRAGKIVSIAMDQSASFNRVFVKFMGRWISTFKAPAVIHFRTEAPIIPVYSVREEDGSHTAFLLPEIVQERTGNMKRDVYQLTQKLADIQSEFILRRPELWFWLHRRWKIEAEKNRIPELERLASNQQETDGAKRGG